MSRPDLRLAMLQCVPHPRDVAANLARLDALLMHADAQGTDVMIVPELFLTGYAIGADSIAELAEPRDGPAFEAIASMARRHGMAIAYGYPEREGRAVYNAAAFVDSNGERLAHYRKTHLFGDLDRAQFTAGEAPSRVVSWRGWNVGLLICYDIEFPEPARALALQGADLLIVPTANMIDFDVVPRTLVPARAYENQVFVVYVNYTGNEGEVAYGGLSLLAGPDGLSRAQAGREESLMIVDCSAAQLEASRARCTFLADRRGWPV